MSEKHYFVYILASKIGGTLYVGLTNNLIRRVYEHRTGGAPGFTKRHRVCRLVYFEQFGEIKHAIARESI